MNESTLRKRGEKKLHHIMWPKVAMISIMPVLLLFAFSQLMLRSRGPACKNIDGTSRSMHAIETQLLADFNLAPEAGVTRCTIPQPLGFVGSETSMLLRTALPTETRDQWVMSQCYAAIDELTSSRVQQIVSRIDTAIGHDGFFQPGQALEWRSGSPECIQQQGYLVEVVVVGSDSSCEQCLYIPYLDLAPK